ncbi:MmcQ/YjbR family DNA-binding protein [Priestia taiwanensis]|uniref:MmcQ/YjbR family DNA-binding protein n=1 Tax=Priestia taiwanensis TaxID=1347902 RepID=A0A917ALK5_9BACI|nr:MmcQ/YjbR family DNA-binding protein [Priestia taiwanensis]MBM7362247.1 putative DNA-binding protein (MmcQ/YjbR family) [Priestia taiwanensis]GGE60635.1 hypothetical protein GCM10007140_08680 [Priestia taiwanensis]
MKTKLLHNYCQRQVGAIHDYKAEWNADRYLIGGKMFVMFHSDAAGRAILSLKCDPIRAEHLRREYEDIIPGYYMNKTHWNSIYLDATFPDDLWKNLIVHSYELIYSKLTKKVKEEIATEQKSKEQIR